MPKAAHPERFRDRWRIRWIDHEGKRRGALFDRYDDAERELARRQTEARDVSARPSCRSARGQAL